MGGEPKLEQIKNLNSVNGDNQALLSFVSVCGDGGAAQEVLAPPLVPARLEQPCPSGFVSANRQSALKKQNFCLPAGPVCAWTASYLTAALEKTTDKNSIRVMSR